jgi:RNA polymerase sigma-70 factor, ECF subfamily
MQPHDDGNPTPPPAHAGRASARPLSDADSAGAGGDLTFEALFATYRAPIHSYVHRLMGNREDADDLTQETFAKLYRALPRFRPVHVRGWVYRIATNACLDELRHRSLVRWEPWEAPVAAAHGNRAATDDPVRDVLREETRHEVVAVLDRLPPRFRTPLVLRELHGLGSEEIASALGTTRGAVKSVLMRARARFRQEWIGLHGVPSLQGLGGQPPFTPFPGRAGDGDAVVRAG